MGHKLNRKRTSRTPEERSDSRRVYEAYILEVKSTAPDVNGKPAGSDRWSCAGEQVTPPPPLPLHPPSRPRCQPRIKEIVSSSEGHRHGPSPSLSGGVDVLAAGPYFQQQHTSHSFQQQPTVQGRRESVRAGGAERVNSDVMEVLKLATNP
ncbi:unnamed protein product [Pleuronectes platessa]|uniref:Uncharacterized protein n=1 Tax=Pleuronectes platessa TaxID=8262 RepID=A0A9N7TUE9_PLEPL|nr:unnamed protein product [Pleuronectes platessa]